MIVVERYDTTAFRGRPETSEFLVATDTLFRGIRDLLATEYAVGDTVCGKFITDNRKN